MLTCCRALGWAARIFLNLRMMQGRLIEDVIRPMCGGWELSTDTLTPKPGYTSLATAPNSPQGLEGMPGIETGICELLVYK